MKTISELMVNLEPGRCLLQSSMSSGSTYFTPWFYHTERKVWYGATRWYGNNNKDISFTTRRDDKKIWKVAKDKVPILPYDHPVRKRLESSNAKMNYIVNQHLKTNRNGTTKTRNY